MNRRTARVRGFTMMETITSAAVLTLIVFAAVGASQVAIRTTSGVVDVESTGGRTRSALERLRSLLLSASTATLQGVPATGGVTAEPMQEKVAYDDLRFRQVTGYANGGPVYDPPPNEAALRIHHDIDQAGHGSLVLDDGRSSTILVDGVTRVTFVRTGRQIQVTVVTDSPDATGSTSSELELRLMVP